MTDILDHAREALEGVTPGPWVFDDHAEDDYDTVTVSAATHLASPGCYTSTDLIHEVDTFGIEFGDRDYQQIVADARFIAQARWLLPALVAEVERLRG